MSPSLLKKKLAKKTMKEIYGILEPRHSVVRTFEDQYKYSYELNIFHV